jgi:Zn-dependent protease
MLFTILSSDMEFGLKLVYFMIMIISLLPALTLHEWAHGYAAYKLGDDTAKADGRLSLNPLDHLDPMGAIMMLLVGFGWAKPVPINTRKFKKPKRDIAITSIAGPLMNFIVAIISGLLFVLSVYICRANNITGITAEVIVTIFNYSMLLNIGLGLFNLIPIPPLDGSNVLMCALPPKVAMQYSKLRYYSHYIMIGIVLLNRMPYPLSMISDIIFMPLDFLRGFLSDAIITVGNLIFSFIF